MTRANGTNRMLTGTATALLLAALLWSALLLAREPAWHRQHAQQQTLMSRLGVLEHDAAVLAAMRQPFAAAGPGAEVATQMNTVFGNDRTAETRVQTEAAGAFRLHTVTVEYPAVAYETLSARIRAAEALRPPLKLEACVLEAAPGKTGEGRARLAFERIEWL